MALRIPDIEVSNKAAAVRPGTVVLGIGLGGGAKDLLSAAEAPDAIGVFDRMPRFMPQNAHAPFGCSSFDFQHFGQFKFYETRVGEVKRDRNSGNTVGRQPFVGQPEVRTEPQLLRLEFIVELLNVSRQ